MTKAEATAPVGGINTVPTDPYELRLMRDEYKKQGYALISYDDGPVHSSPYDAPWLTDKTFSATYDKIRNNTLVDRPRCYSLYLLTQQIKSVPGNILEVGTWRGGTAGLLAASVPAKTVFIADTFEGVVKSSDWEHYSDRAHADTSEQVVTDLLQGTLGASNFRLMRGIFPEDTGHQVESETFAFVYLDLDVYLSTKDAFNFVWEKLSPYGVVAFDDYGMVSACEGISRFIHEIKDDEDKLFIHNLNGQAYIIKKSSHPHQTETADS